MKKTGFTLNELFAVVAIIAILAAILFPVFARAIEGEKAKQAICISNLKKLGSAFKQYAQDNDGKLPMCYRWNTAHTAMTWWYQIITPYVAGSVSGSQFGGNFMRCPSAGPIAEPALYSYGVNYGAVMYENYSAKIDKIPSAVFIATDSWYVEYYAIIYSPKIWLLNTDADGDGIIDSSLGKLSAEHWFNGARFGIHSDGANYVFADGHVKWLSKLAWLSNKNDMWGANTTTAYW